MFVDIPDDEAQYWTSKLEWINTMSIDEEVKSHSFFQAGPVPQLLTSLFSCSTLSRTRVTRCLLLPPSAVSTCS